MLVSRLRECPLLVTVTMPILSDWTTKFALRDRFTSAYSMATHSPISTMIASAQPISNFCFGPTAKPGAHFHTPHQFLITRPTPNKVLVSPHQSMSIGLGEDNGIVFSTLYKIWWIHSKSTTTGCGGWSLAMGDLKFLAKQDNGWRKGQMSGKMQEICTSFPWRLNAQRAEYLECGASQESNSTLMAISFPSGKDMDCWFISQSKPIYLWMILNGWPFSVLHGTPIEPVKAMKLFYDQDWPGRWMARKSSTHFITIPKSAAL